MKHRLLAGALALMMTLVPMSGNAGQFAPIRDLTVTAEDSAKAPTVWDGTADTSWYTAEHGTYTVNGVEWAYYEIGTAEELAGLSKLVRNGNSMENTYIQLTNDIILNDTSNIENWANEPPANNWTPIGAVPYQSPYFQALFSTVCQLTEFAGMFNGDGHTITGMYCKHDCRAGLFACVSGGVFRTTVKDSYVECVVPPASWDAMAGGITADCAQGVINQCEFDGTVYANHSVGPVYGDHDARAGGIVGNFQDKKPLTIMFTLFTAAAFGFVINPLLLLDAEPSNPIASPGIYNCVNHGKVQAVGGMSGGILGWGNWNMIMRNCYSDGEITSDTNKAYAIAGRTNSYYIVNSYFENAESSSPAAGTEHDASVYLTAAGLSREEAAKKLGVFFRCTEDTVHLNFFPELPEEPTETTEETSETAETTAPTTEPTTEETTAAPTTETLPPIELDVPTVTLPGDINAETTSVKVSWGKVENAAQYEFELAADEDFTDLAIHAFRSDNADTVDYLHYGRTYHFRVRACAYREEDKTYWYSDWSYADLTIPSPEDPHLVIPEPVLDVGFFIPNLMVSFPGMENASEMRMTASWNADLSEPFDCQTIEPGRWYQPVLLDDAKGKTLYLKAEARTTIADQTFYAEPRDVAIHVAEDGTMTAETLAPPTEPTENTTEEPITETTEAPTTEATEASTTEATETPTTEPTEAPTTETTETPTTEPTKPASVCGDVDGSGAVDALDAAEILLYAAALGAGETYDNPAFAARNADTDGNGTIDAIDASNVLIYAAIVGAEGNADWADVLGTKSDPTE